MQSERVSFVSFASSVCAEPNTELVQMWRPNPTYWQCSILLHPNINTSCFIPTIHLQFSMSLWQEYGQIALHVNIMMTISFIWHCIQQIKNTYTCNNIYFGWSRCDVITSRYWLLWRQPPTVEKLFVIAEVKQAVKHGCRGAAGEAGALGGEILRAIMPFIRSGEQ